jgi:Carbohydrate binding module (family 6)
VDHGFFLILDLAIGGGYPNGVCGCTSPSSFTSSGGTTGSTQFDARVASGAASGVSGLVEVVLDNPSNAPVGSFALANTGGWSTWKTVPANISKVTGTHNVYLEFVSGAGGNPPFASLHYFNFPAT